MKSFKQFLNEIVSGISSLPKKTKLRGMEEHDEVHHQLKAHEEGHVSWHPDVHQALKHLSDPSKFKSALSNGTIERYTPEKFKSVGNTEAGTKQSNLPSLINRQKLRRAREQKSRGESHPPIVLRTRNKTTGETREHLLAGNTAATVSGGHTQALVITHNIG